MFRHMLMFFSDILPTPTLKLEDHPLLAIHDRWFSTPASNPHMWGTVLYPQPEDTPFLDEKGLT